MDRGTFRLFGLTLAVLIVVVAAVATLAGGTTSDPDAPQGDQVVGIVTSIDSGGLADVRSFTLRARDGRELVFRVGVLENGTEFPPGHLAEHQTLVTPIRVWYRTADGERIAFRLEDVEE